MPEKKVTLLSLKARTIKFEEAKRKLISVVNEDKSTLFAHETLQIQIFYPAKEFRPLPHLRDEIYFVIEGSGEINDGESRQKLEQGDFVFVPAGEKHGLKKISEDFIVWKVSYGPGGGELRGRDLLCPFDVFEH